MTTLIELNNSDSISFDRIYHLVWLMQMHILMLFLSSMRIGQFSTVHRPSHYTRRRGDQVNSRTCATWRKLWLMEKILALIAVSLGKKATVYAVGRVSTSYYPEVEFCRFVDLLCPDTRCKIALVVDWSKLCSRMFSWAMIFSFELWKTVLTACNWSVIQVFQQSDPVFCLSLCYI